MLAFVDESGDPGLKLCEGSSRYFVVALVIFEDHDEAEAANARITSLRVEARLSPQYEFRFNKCGKDLRIQFLTTVAPFGFFYYGIVIDKDPDKLWGEGFKHKESFYKYASGLVFENAKTFLNGATVIIDGSGSRDFRRQLQSYLKRRINDKGQRAIAKVKTQKSCTNNLIQLADMVAGSINRSLGSKTDAESYRKIIRHREIYVQRWPK